MDIISHFSWSLYQNLTELSNENTFQDRIYTTNVRIHRLMHDIPRFLILFLSNAVPSHKNHSAFNTNTLIIYLGQIQPDIKTNIVRPWPFAPGSYKGSESIDNYGANYEHHARIQKVSLEGMQV